MNPLMMFGVIVIVFVVGFVMIMVFLCTMAGFPIVVIHVMSRYYRWRAAASCVRARGYLYYDKFSHEVYRLCLALH